MDEFDNDKIQDDIDKENRKQFSLNYGWICPVCGRGNSPMSNTCICQPSPRYEITC